jgi:alpha-D-ribose 1-methylphosphonate 5-triphosphate synthase subunit PhnI
MLFTLHIALLIQVLAIAFDFAIGLIDLYERSQPQQSVQYFPDTATEDDTPDFYDQVIREQVVMEANYRQELNLDVVYEPVDFQCMTIRELKAIAKDQRIKGYGRMVKSDLIRALTT